MLAFCRDEFEVEGLWRRKESKMSVMHSIYMSIVPSCSLPSADMGSQGQIDPGRPSQSTVDSS